MSWCTQLTGWCLCMNKIWDIFRLRPRLAFRHMTAFLAMAFPNCKEAPPLQHGKTISRENCPVLSSSMPQKTISKNFLKKICIFVWLITHRTPRLTWKTAAVLSWLNIINKEIIIKSYYCGIICQQIAVYFVCREEKFHWKVEVITRKMWCESI